MSGTNAGAMLGSGIYITTTLEKAMNYAKVKEHSGAIFKLKVNLGNCLELKRNDPHMTDWHTLGYDSAFSPAGANGQREENCVRDPSRIQIEDVILGHTGHAARAGFSVFDGRLYHKLQGVPTVMAQLARPTAGVLLLDHRYARCNGVFRYVGESRGGYPLLINQSGMELSRHWAAGGVWCLSSAFGTDDFVAYSVATDGEIPIGTTEWEVVSADNLPNTERSTRCLCTTMLLSDMDPVTAVVEDCYNKAAMAEGHVDTVKSAIKIAAGVGVAAATSAGAVAAAPAVVAAGVALGQGAAIGAVSGVLAVRSILKHPVLGPAAREALKASPHFHGLSEDDLVMRFAAGGATLGAGRVVAIGTAAVISAGIAVGTDMATAGAAAVAGASPVVPAALAVLAVTAVVTTYQSPPEPEPEPEPEPLDLTASVGDPVVASEHVGDEHAEYEIRVRTEGGGVERT